ncbi:MAG: hypothetical protein JWP08_2087 [Bryobacterales bacterium]|nr:hypothetical protein [Bryobacterales bacterium]
MSLIHQATEPERRPKSPLRAILPYTTVLTIIVALYVAWIMYSRHQTAVDSAQVAEDQKAEAQKRVSDQIFGSGEVKFTTLEASDAEVRPGQTTQLCYGVVNATSVKIDPPIEQIKPSSRHCMEIAPKKTTAYTVTASDAKGNSKSLTLTIRVK